MKHLLLLLLFTVSLNAALKDVPFPQDRAVKFTATAELNAATYERLEIEREGIVYVRTDRGVARVFGEKLALDRSFRPLSGLKAKDIALGKGQLYYLYDDKFLSNGDTGRPIGHLPANQFTSLAIADNGAVLLAGANNLALFINGKSQPLPWPTGTSANSLYSHGNDFYAIFGNDIYRMRGQNVEKFHSGSGLTTLAFREKEIVVGTTNGIYGLSLRDGKETFARITRLPVLHITCLAVTEKDIWAGTPQGAFRRKADGTIDYYASGRWLLDDAVKDLQLDAAGNAYVLTKTGLTKIEFTPMTLAEKAAYYDAKIRNRHVRFGFTAELMLKTPGDVSTAEMIDTDNDGTWSNYYMASQGFRFGATGDEQARHNAWQTFAAMERLEEINPLEGFPSRTFERRGFKFSDVDRWHPTEDGDWDWKAHTSSDEIAAHTFGCAVMYETVAKTKEEKARVATFFDKVATHIIRNNYYLIDMDGKPTLWARWNPEYVNNYPPTVVDRRLNSSEIIATLQLAYHMTQKPIYKEKAFELMNQHGYLANIQSSTTNVAFTKDALFQGINMGDEWNHSDDLLGFITYWVLHRYAFNGELKAKYAAAVRDHWLIEKHEQNPIWNFVYAACGGKDADLEGAAWTLRQFPLDLITWSIKNSHRQDITKLEPNFRGEEVRELLPHDERQITRWNTQPFILDGGNNGNLEFCGDEYLLPYWMGRYLKLIK